MRENGLQGAKRRGKPWRTTLADPSARRSPDLVQRDFTASRPDETWFGTSRICVAGRGWCSSAS